MERIRRWLDGSSLARVFAYLAAVWVALQLVFRFVESGRITIPDLIGTLAGGLVFAGIMTALLGYRRRRSGGAATFIAINRSVRTGILPDDAEPTRWLPELVRRERSLRIAVWLNPVIFGLFVVLGCVVLVLDSSTWLWLGIIALFVVIGIVNEFAVVRQVRVARSLIDRLASPVSSAR